MTEEMITIENAENTAEDTSTTTVGSRPRLFFVQVTNHVEDNPNSGKRLWVGPINEKEGAEELAQNLSNEYAEYSFEPMGKIEARRNGMRSPSMGDSVDTLVEEFTTEDEVWNAIPAEEEKTKRGRPRNEEGEQRKTKTTMKREREPAMKKNKEDRIVIVTSSSGLIALLAMNGIVGEVIPRVEDVEQIDGAIVYGNLPPWWARYTKKFYVINTPGLTGDQKGSNRLTPQDYLDAGITLDEYVTEFKHSTRLK